MTTDIQSDIGPDLSTALVMSGIPLYEMRRIQATLEDVFLNLTTEDVEILAESQEVLQHSANSVVQAEEETS